MLSLDAPAIDFVGLAKSLGVDGVRCDTAEDFDRQCARLLAARGPNLIEAVF
jgi:acetolactate synthase-1/2/3 large subunit